jgi:hypothetical protein
MRRGLSALLAGFLLLANPGVALGQHEPSGLPADAKNWQSLRQLLRSADGAFATGGHAEQAAAAVSTENLTAALDWSGEAGYLLWVRLQTPENGSGSAVPLGAPVLLGVGTTPLDAAAAAFFDSPVVVPPAPSMRLAEDRSFFVWVTRHGGRLRFAALTPSETAAVRSTAEEIIADRRRRSNRFGDRVIRIMSGIRETLARRPNAGGAIARVDPLLAAYRSAQEALVSAEGTSLRAMEWQLLLDKALQRVEGYRNILTLEGLKAQANGLLWPGMQKQVRGTRSAEALVAMLTLERDNLRNRAASVNVPAARTAELQAYQAFVRGLGEVASDPALRRLLPARTL